MHPSNWLFRSPIPMNPNNTMKARDACVYVYLCVHTAPASWAFYIVRNQQTQWPNSIFLSGSLLWMPRAKKRNVVHNFSFQISSEADEPFHPALVLPAVRWSKFPPRQGLTPQPQVCMEALRGKHGARAMAPERLKEAIQRHHSLSTQAANANVRDVMLHGSPS